MTDGPRSVTSRTEPPPYRGANPTAVRFWPRPYALYTRLTGLAGPPHNNNPRGGKRNTCLALLSKRPIPFFCSLAAPIHATSSGLSNNLHAARLNSFPSSSRVKFAFPNTCERRNVFHAKELFFILSYRWEFCIKLVKIPFRFSLMTKQLDSLHPLPQSFSSFRRSC